MDVTAALSVALQLLALFPSIEPAAIKAVEDFKNLFTNGQQPTQADIDALINKIKTQSAQIQAL